MKKNYLILINVIFVQSTVFKQQNVQKNDITVFNLDFFIITILQEIDVSLAKHLLDSIKYKLKQIQNHQSQKDFLINNNKKTRFLVCFNYFFFLFMLIIIFYINCNFSPRNEIKDEKINEITIDKRTLKKKDQDLIYQKKFLIFETNGSFKLLKKLEPATKYKQTYIVEEFKLLNFFLQDSWFKILLKKQLQENMFYNKQKPIECTIGFLNFANFQNLNIKDYFLPFSFLYFSEFVYQKALNNQIIQADYSIESIFKTKICKKGFFNIRKLIFNRIEEKIKEKQIEGAQSFLEVFIENCPKVKEIQRSIEHKFDLKTNKSSLILNYKGKALKLSEQPNSQVFSFLFHDQSFKTLYNKKFPKSKGLIIKPSIKEEIENTAKESFFVSYHRIMFFQETFRNIDREPDNKVNWHNARSTLKELNPLITSTNLVKRFVESVFKEKERLLRLLNKELMNTTNEEEFIKKYMTIYPKIDLIKKCFLFNEKYLFCINDGYGNYHKSSLSFFLNSFFDEINKGKDSKKRINIELPQTSDKNQPVSIEPNEIRSLQADLNGCFYLWEETHKDLVIQKYQIPSYLTEFKIPKNQYENQKIWKHLKSEQETKIKKYIKRNPQECDVQVGKLKTIIPQFFLKNRQKLVEDFEKRLFSSDGPSEKSETKIDRKKKEIDFNYFDE